MKEVRELRKKESAERASKAKALRDREKAIAAAEAEVLHLESQQRTVMEELESPKCYDNPGMALQLNRDLRLIQQRIAEATTRWDQLAAEHTADEPLGV
jgi:hypothetical protein